ncbi:MAG: methyltransferase domain-containing protein [Chloroflexota bacterium]
MTDTDLYLQRLWEANPLREPLLRSIIQALQLPSGSHGLDVGCGIGLQALLLAQAVGADGHITGIDINPELLAVGGKVAAEAGFSERITFREGDMNRLPFAEDTFHWAWSADCIGYPAGELLPILAELVRVVKPGGSIIILGWSSQQVLPGHPLLEARLNATCSGYIPFLTESKVASHFLRALPWFRKAGLQEVAVQTFVGEVRDPLTAAERTALTSLFEMLWGQPQPEVSAEDWQACQQLCKQGSPEFILDIPDYYAFFTYSVFQGKVPRKD